jgi:hypothetical protein
MADDRDPILSPDPETRPVPSDPIDTGNTSAADRSPPETQPVATTESMLEALDRLYGGNSPAPVPAPAPAPASRVDSDTRASDIKAVTRPDGGHIAMRLLLRMQTDLAVLTQDKRPATYEEVDEAFGHALRAEGLAVPAPAPVESSPQAAPVDAPEATVTENASAPVEASDNNSAASLPNSGDLIDTRIDQSTSGATTGAPKQPPASAPGAPASAPPSSIMPAPAGLSGPPGARIDNRLCRNSWFVSAPDIARISPADGCSAARLTSRK